jgi:hypothetical protein
MCWRVEHAKVNPRIDHGATENGPYFPSWKLTGEEAMDSIDSLIGLTWLNNPRKQMFPKMAGAPKNIPPKRFVIIGAPTNSSQTISMGFPMNYDSYDMVDHPSSKYP